MPKTLSCGVLLANEYDELLMCHVTCGTWWDIPKGGCDVGETPLAAAVRETHEETGIALRPEILTDLGVVPYRPDKALHLFAARVSRAEINPADCLCTSYFAHPRTGQALPEVDGFAWVPFDAVGAHCAKAMHQVLAGRLSLPDILARLPAETCLAP